MTIAGRIDAGPVVGARSTTVSTTVHLVVLACGLAALAAVVVSDDPVAYFVGPLVLPAGAVLTARAVARRAVTEPDLRGYAKAAAVVGALAVLGVGFHAWPGPAAMLGLAFAYLGWLRRDSLVASTGVAVVLATALVDVTGPVRLSYETAGSPTRALALLVTAVLVAGVAAWAVARPGAQRRDR